jgi:hypothetical protein
MAGGAGDGDDGMESFSIDDYDLQSALNPGSRRRGLSKNQQIYGELYLASISNYIFV